MERFLMQSAVTSCVLLSAGIAQAAQPTLVAIDGSGRTVGAVTGAGLVFLTLQPNLDFVQMRVQAGQLGSVGDEYYTTSDCTGAVYLFSPSLLRNGYLMREDPGTIIFADTNVPPVKVGFIMSGKVGVAKCAPVNVTPLPMAYPVLKARMDQQGLTPPFSVKLQ